LPAHSTFLWCVAVTENITLAIFGGIGLLQVGHTPIGLQSSKIINHKDLADTYAGASAGGALGAGFGANVLVSGSNNTIALQPLRGEGSVGLSVALGITVLSMR